MDSFILITGATSGLGLSFARRMSQDRNVLLIGRNEDKLRSAVSSCSGNGKVLPLRCDLDKDIKDVSQLLSDFIQSNGITIDSFVHFAGVTRILPIRRFPLSDVLSIFNTNFFSAVEIIKTLLSRANKKALKDIVLISALWSIRGDKANSIYAASKGAINSLVFSLAKELAPIRINAVSPGGIDTPMTHELMQSEWSKAQEKEYPLGYGKIDDVLNAVEFLLSDKSSWITGQNMSVDGGRSIY